MKFSPAYNLSIDDKLSNYDVCDMSSDRHRLRKMAGLCLRSIMLNIWRRKVKLRITACATF